MNDIIYKEESYLIIGGCIEVYNNLGRGFNEIVYKDALEIEFNSRSIPFEREKKFKIIYKSIILLRSYHADFIVFDKIILEIPATTWLPCGGKAIESINSGNVKQTLNYLAASKLKLALLVNFGENLLKYKRIRRRRTLIIREHSCNSCL